MLLYFFRSINLLSNRIPHLESRNLIRQEKYGNRIIILPQIRNYAPNMIQKRK